MNSRTRKKPARGNGEAFHTADAAETLGTQHLMAYFARSGLLLCNENRELPSLASVGGDWNGIVALIERGQIFYSKVYKGRVTYLSRACYEQVKPYKQRLDRLSPEGRAILEFLSSVGLAGTAEIKGVLCMSGARFSKGMDELSRELLVTAIERDRTMNENWSSFRWGTYRNWEQRHPLPGSPPSEEALRSALGSVLNDKQIRSLLR